MSDGADSLCTMYNIEIFDVSVYQKQSGSLWFGLRMGVHPQVESLAPFFEQTCNL